MERDEHKLVVDTLSKLESERKAFRLVGGVLVERTVGDVLPAVSQNYEGVRLNVVDLLRFNNLIQNYAVVERIVDKVRRIIEAKRWRTKGLQGKTWNHDTRGA